VALGYAKLAAKAFGIATDRKIDYGTLPDREVEFDVNAAKEDVAGDGNSKKAQKSRGKSVK
jgi:hypothetical protein